jgi:hypothetical protein
VRHLGEAFAGLATDTLGRRVGRDELWVGLLKLLQAVHQRVILRIGDFGRVEDVVEMLVVANLFAQRLDLFFSCRCSRHSEDYRERKRWQVL